MIIGQLTNWLSSRGGGVPAVVLPLAAKLEKFGVAAPVFGMLEKQGRVLQGFEYLDARTFRPIDGGLFGYAPGLTATLVNERLSLLHQHALWRYPSIACMRWYAKTARPYMVSPHGMLNAWSLNSSAWKKRLAGLLFQREQLRHAACLHALCESEYHSIRSYGLSNPVAIIPNGVVVPGPCQVRADPAWIEGLPADSRVLLFLSRLHPKKGLVNLLLAWARVRQQRSIIAEPWHLVIAGWDQGGHQAHLEHLATALGISDRVHFVGPQFDDDKAASFGRADAFVLPSFDEGLPIAVLEAWSYGLPCLITPECNLPEGFSENSAIKITYNDGAEGLVTLFSMSDEQRSAMGVRGAALVLSRFTWDAVASSMADVYRWLLDEGEKPDCIVD